MYKFTTRWAINTGCLSVFSGCLCRDSAASMTTKQAPVSARTRPLTPSNLLTPLSYLQALQRKLAQTTILKGGKDSWKSRHLLQVILQLLQHGFQLRHFLFEVPRRVTATQTHPQPVRRRRRVGPIFTPPPSPRHQKSSFVVRQQQLKWVLFQDGVR